MISAASHLRRARRKAGLTQRGLARKARIPQPTIAAIEAGRQGPRFSTLDRLLRACGYELDIVPEPGRGVDRTQFRELLRLPPAERLRLAAADARGLAKLDRARRR